MSALYLDMDGVVADFNKYAKSILHSDIVKHTWDTEEWKLISADPRLYKNLDLTPEAKMLVHACQNFCARKNYELLFLTAVPKANDIPYAFYDKVLWALKYFPSIPVMFGPYSKDKWLHCNPGDILIDDRPSNCKEWQAAGGISILYEGNLSDTLNKLNLL